MSDDWDQEFGFDTSFNDTQNNASMLNNHQQNNNIDPSFNNSLESPNTSDIPWNTSFPNEMPQSS